MGNFIDIIFNYINKFNIYDNLYIIFILEISILYSLIPLIVIPARSYKRTNINNKFLYKAIMYFLFFYVFFVIISCFINILWSILIIFSLIFFSTFILLIWSYNKKKQTTLHTNIFIGIIANLVPISLGLLFNITIFLLTKIYILPNNYSIGITLLSTLLIIRFVNIFIQIDYYVNNIYNETKIHHYKTQIKFNILSSINGINVGIIIIYAIFFSLNDNNDLMSYRQDNKSIELLKENTTSFKKSLNQVSDAMNELSSAKENAQFKLDSLDYYFTNINFEIKNLSITKEKLEKKVHDLESKSDAEIKKRAEYKAIYDAVNQNTIYYYIITFVIGCLSSFVANLLMLKRKNKITANNVNLEPENHD